MEETVSVLIWECWLWEDTMDMTDWARLLLAGSVQTGGRKETGGQAWLLGAASPCSRSGDSSGLARPSPTER